MFDQDEIFNGNTLRTKMNASVPDSLVRLISLLLEGGKSSKVISPSLRRVSTNIAQLIRFNSVKQVRRTEVENFRHMKSNEPPLPVKIALLIYAKTKKRKPIEQLHYNGLCISYERVLEIKRTIKNQVCEEFEKEGFVSPPHLENDVFTTAAIDNLDHNPMSVTAESSFRGTTISIFQHFLKPGYTKIPFHMKDVMSSKRKNKSSLPESYTDIQPTKESKVENPCKKMFTEFQSTMSDIHKYAEGWTDRLSIDDNHDATNLSFSSYYSKQQNDNIIPQTSSHLLPLLNHPVQSYATVRQCTKIVKNIVEKVNPGQFAVITCDEPVYAIGKQLQWSYPEEFKKVIWMMGPLHGSSLNQRSDRRLNSLKSWRRVLTHNLIFKTSFWYIS